MTFFDHCGIIQDKGKGIMMKKIIKTILSDTSPSGCVVLSTPEIQSVLLRHLSHTMHHITFHSFDEFKKEIYPPIDLSLPFKNRQDDTRLDIVKLKLQQAYLVEEDSQHPVLHELYTYKTSNQLVKNQMMDAFYQDKRIYVIQYYHTDDILEQALFGKDVVYLYKEQLEEQKQSIYSFANLEDEVFYCVNEIAKLLLQGVLPHQIVIHKPETSYCRLLQEAFDIYHIDYAIEEKKPFIAYEYTKRFVETLEQLGASSLAEALQIYIASHQPSDILRQLIQALSPLISLDLPFQSDLMQESIQYLLSTCTYQQERFTSVIQIEDITHHIYDEDTHLFILHLNQDVLPIIHKDNDYLEDSIKAKLGLPTSILKNQGEQEKVRHILWGYPHIHLSMQSQEPVSSIVAYYQKKGLIEEWISPFSIEDVISKSYAQLRFQKAKMQYNKYRTVSQDFIKGYATFSPIIAHYDSQFTHISKEVLQAHTNQLTLSYTSMSEYMHCPFSYYVRHILGIREKMEENNSLFVGTMYHDVLQKVINDIYIQQKDRSHIHELIEAYLTLFLQEKNITLTPKLSFYLKKYKLAITTLLEVMFQFMDDSSFQVEALEKEIRVALDEHTTCMGVIDKILKYQNYYVVLDYKTHAVSVDWHALDVGIDLQLPIYFYLIHAIDHQARIAGGYLQSVYDSNLFTYDTKKSYQQQFLKAKKYQGYTIQNPEIIFAIDHQVMNGGGCLPTQIFTSKKTFHANFINRSFTQEQLDTLIQYTEQLIIQQKEKIQAGRFAIEPLVSDKGESKCGYCNARDLCYKTVRMNKVYKKHPDFSYIFGGNAHGHEME